MLKAAAASPDVRTGDCFFNAGEIVKAMARASGDGVDVIVFPELSVTSCSCGDLFAYTVLTDAAKAALRMIVERTKDFGLTGIVGLPLGGQGGVKNGAAVFSNGRLRHVFAKGASRARYGVTYPFAEGEAGGFFDFFGEIFPVETDAVFEIGGAAAAVLIGDDVLCRRYADRIILNPNCDVEYAGRARLRAGMIARVSAGGCAVVSAFPSPGESTTDFVYPGHCLIAVNGVMTAEAAPFRAGYAAGEIPRRFVPVDCEEPDPRARQSARHPFLPPEDGGRTEEYETVLAVQSRGLAGRLRYVGAKKALVGVSGGLDSALALLVACRAMDLLGRPRSDVIAVSMPAFGTTGRTRNNAERLSRLLGTDFRLIDITGSVRLHFSDIGHSGSVADAAFENAQARERTQILMDLANMEGGIHVGTGDLSELALGFATYGGDQISMYAVNGSVPKTLVRALTAYCGETAGGELQAVLADICATPVSPELQPVRDGEQLQITEEIVGPYELHDFFIYHMFVYREEPREIFGAAVKSFAGVYGAKTVKRWLLEFLRRFFSQQFKRSLMPDGPMATPVSFSPRSGLAMPSDMSASAWILEAESLPE